jgi:tripartite-type tricarboxylate transporter receptor subunit TctC
MPCYLAELNFSFAIVKTFMTSISTSLKLTFLGLLVCPMLTFHVAMAQNNYPTKALHFVVGFAPGGPTDVISRILAKRFTEVLGQAVIVDNKPGADSLIATKLVSQSEPDGLNLLIASGSHTINPSLYPDSKMDPVKDFTPIGLIGDSSNFLVVHPQVPVNSVEELIAYAKKNPGKLNYASSASTIYLQTELFKSMANVDMTPIPYKGAGVALTALLGNEVQVSISSIVTLTQHVKSGKVRALAVTSAKRSVLAPDVPTVTEKGLPGYVASTWYGILTAPGTPAHIVKTLNTSLNQILQEPEAKAQLLGQGLEPMATTPEEFTKFLSEDQVKWAKVVRESHPKN